MGGSLQQNKTYFFAKAEKIYMIKKHGQHVRQMLKNVLDKTETSSYICIANIKVSTSHN